MKLGLALYHVLVWVSRRGNGPLQGGRKLLRGGALGCQAQGLQQLI